MVISKLYQCDLFVRNKDSIIQSKLQSLWLKLLGNLHDGFRLHA